LYITSEIGISQFRKPTPAYRRTYIVVDSTHTAVVL